MDLTSPGRVLGNRYELVEPLARGGMATVWIADDSVLSRRVAVKVLRADLAEDDATRARFRNEAIAAARLNHPNIVATFDTGDDDGTAYIVMELVEGTNLRHLVDQHGGLPVADVVRIGRQVADALEAAHRAGLVHRDVKPANVLVPTAPGADDDTIPRGPVKVTDFGIAKATGADELTRTGTVMGTARYLAPEQVNGRAADARTDVYALGLLLYELCCGHPPFGGDTDIATAMARLTTTAPPIRAERPDVPRALDDLVHRCLARDPAQRYPSAAAVSRALAEIGSGQAASGRTATGGSTAAARPAEATTTARTATTRSAPNGAAARSSRPAPRRRRRGSWLWFVAVVLVAVAAGLAAFLIVRDQSDNGGAGSGSGLPSADTAAVLASAFDPQGGDGENDAQVRRAFDDDASSSWPTETYNSFSLDKDGVGLALDLQRRHEVSSVSVDTVQGGWSAAVYVSDRPVAELLDITDWGDPLATADVAGTSHAFDTGAVAGRSVLVWFTSLPVDDEGRQQLSVTEVRLG